MYADVNQLPKSSIFLVRKKKLLQIYYISVENILSQCLVGLMLYQGVTLQKLCIMMK